MKNTLELSGFLTPAAPVAIAVALASLVSPSQAQNIFVLNSSFETPGVAGRPFDFQDNSGLGAGSAIPENVQWYYLGGFIQSGSPAGVQVSASSGMTLPPDGTQSLYLNNGSWAGSSNLATIQANTTYTLDLWEGNRTGFPQTAGFTIALAFGAAPGTGLTNSSQWLTFAHYNMGDPGTPAAGNWGHIAPLSFTTGSSDTAIGQSLFILLGSDANPNSFAQQVNFDNATVTVPEPSAVALFSMALAGLAFRRRRS